MRVYEDIVYVFQGPNMAKLREREANKRGKGGGGGEGRGGKKASGKTRYSRGV